MIEEKRRIPKDKIIKFINVKQKRQVVHLQRASIKIKRIRVNG